MSNPNSEQETEIHPFLRYHGLPIVIILSLTFLGFFGSDVTLWLRFDRNAIFAGEIWRLLSGHLTHLSWSHLLMNAAGLALIWALFRRRLSNGRWIQVMVISALLISLLLLLLNPQLRWYVGFSGILHAMFVVGCIYDSKAGRWDAKLLLFIIIAKLAWEQIIGPLPGSETTAGGAVIVDAHLYGAVSGYLIYRFFKYRDEKNNAT
ncbi:MAG: rhombosortase [Gammaproteobacteria bacterium]|nr:rhombosortase [Gammaproteobacteria bacterium]